MALRRETGNGENSGEPPMKGAEGARLARTAESLRQKDRADEAFFTFAVRKRLLLRSFFSRAVVFTTAFF